jgi:hypothetical protein
MISRLDTVNLSNMPVITEEVLDPGVNISSELADIVPTTQHEKWRITKFETTPPMSTYIVAFANGHFEFFGDICRDAFERKGHPPSHLRWVDINSCRGTVVEVDTTRSLSFTY